VVQPGAKLGNGVVVGPFCVIGENVEIGDGTILEPHAVIDGWTRIGKSNRIGVGVVIGVAPQDRAYAGARGFVTVGDGNVFREYVTIHRSAKEDGTTTLGDDNYIMGGVHVAHDCQLGSHITIANMVGLSGHIVVEDHAFLAGITAYHQFVRIGTRAIVGGGIRVGKDVVPFSMAAGDPLRIYGLNRVGLRRAGFSIERMRAIKEAYRILFRSGLTMSAALERLKHEMAGNEDVMAIVKFAEGSKRGLTPGLTVKTGGSEEAEKEAA